MRKVSHILERKSKDLISIKSDATVLDALRLMSSHNIGSVMVMDEGNYKGILTERDYARKVVLQGHSSVGTCVSEIMSSDLPPVTSETTVEHCMQLMAENNIRYLPVFDLDHVSGIISINDLVKEMIYAQGETIQHLRSFIQS